MDTKNFRKMKDGFNGFLNEGIGGIISDRRMVIGSVGLKEDDSVVAPVENPINNEPIQEDNNDGKINKAVYDGMSAFWSEVSKVFGVDADYGDFPPDADSEFEQACLNAVRTWAKLNAK